MVVGARRSHQRPELDVANGGHKAVSRTTACHCGGVGHPELTPLGRREEHIADGGCERCRLDEGGEDCYTFARHCVSTVNNSVKRYWQAAER